MPRSGVTEEQILTAIGLIAAEGEKVTVDRIRKALGDTGSKGTILPVYRRWLAEQRRAPTADADDIPDVVRQAMDQAVTTVWQTCATYASDQIRAIQAAADERIGTAEATLDEAIASIDAYEDELTKALHEIEKLRADNEKLGKQLRTKSTENRLLKSQIKNGSAEITALLKRVVDGDSSHPAS
ncbi:MAG: DNA-binding protein [Chromatiaceae bacterium]|nr:DNA-binding protein [Chromatiaceae bacterium]